ncbi:serine-rich adhesin for platelets [Nilaparvata lugens]|uniref:serine-rich adhesin for platelets n=1 Tax=Nilaparvata lugens TaxID=108931 RepID=UPI00193DFDAE|nr:serine-rich adhesin for platelets [Nilaparvata lugens]
MTNPNKNTRKVVKKTVSQQTDDISKGPMIGSSANVGKTCVRKMAASFKMKSTSSCQTVDLETTINPVTKYPQSYGRGAMQNRRKATNFQVGYNVAQNTMKVGNSGGVSNMVQKSNKQVGNIGVTNTKKSTGTSVTVDGSLLQNNQTNMDMMASTSIQNASDMFQHSKPTDNPTTSTQNTLVPFQHSKPPENQANPLMTQDSLVPFQHSKPSEKQTVLFPSKNHPPKNDKKQDFKSVQQKEKNNTFLDDIRLVLPNSDFSNDIFSTLQVPPGSQHHGSLSPTAAFLDAFPLVSNSKNSEMLIDGDNSDAVHHATDSLLLGDPNILDTSGRQNCLQTLNNYNSVEQHLAMNTDEMTKNPCNKNMNSIHTDQNKANNAMPNQQQTSSAYSISALNSAKPSNSLGEKCADHTNKIQDYQSHYTNVNYDYMSANSFQNYNYNSGYKKVAPKFVDSNYGGDINNSFVSNPRDVNNKMAATTYGSQDGGLGYNAYNNWNPKPSMQLQNFDDFQTNYMSGYNHFPTSSASKNVFASDQSYSTSAGMFGNLSSYKSMDTSDSNFVSQPVASSTKLGSKSDAPANFIYTQASTTSNPITTRSYSCAFSSASDFQAIGFPQSLYSSSTIEDSLSTAPKVTSSKDLMGVDQCGSIVTSQAAQTKSVNTSKSNNSSIGNKFYVGGNPMNKKQPVMFDNASIKTSQTAGMDQGATSNATSSKSSTYFPDLGMNQNNSNSVMSKSSSYFPPSLSTTLNNSFNNSTMLFPAQSTYQNTNIFTTITNQTAGIFSSTTATTHANQTVGIFSSGATTQVNQSVGIFSSGATTQANQSVFTFSSGATTSTTTTPANGKVGSSSETVKTSQPRMSVNWMTMPDPRTSTLEVGSSSTASAPFIPPDRMFTPHKDALDFIAPIITGGLQPTYSTNSQMFYGMDFPISDAQTLCGTDGSITRTTANPQAQTSSSSALHYSWPTSKSSLSLLSHLDNHGLGIPSTLPTLVGDLALGTNTGPSTPGVNGDYRMSSNTTATIFQTLPEVEDRNNQKSLNNTTDVSPVKSSNYCQDNMQPKSALFSTDMPSSKSANYLQAPSKPSNIFDVQSKPSNIFDVQSKLPETPAKSSNFHLDMPTKSSSYSLDVQPKSSAPFSTEVPTSKSSNFLQASSKPSNIFDVQSKTNTSAKPSNFHFNMSGKPSNYMNASSKPSNIFDMNVTSKPSSTFDLNVSSKPSNTFDVTASSNIFDMHSKPSSNFLDTPSKPTNFAMGNPQSHATSAQFDAKSSKNPAPNQGQRSGVVADTSKTSSGPNVSHQQPQSGGSSFLSVSQLVDQVKTNKKQDGNNYKYVQNIMAPDIYYPEITAGSNSAKQVDYKCNTMPMPQKGSTTNSQPLINAKNTYNPQNRDGYSLLSTEGSQKQNLLTFDSATSNQKQNLLSSDGATKNQKQNMLPFDGNATTNQKPKDPSAMQQKSVANSTTRKCEINLQNNNFNDTGLSFLAPSSSTLVAKNSTIPSVAKSSTGSTPVSLPTSLWSQSSSHNVNSCSTATKKNERFPLTKSSSTFKSSNKYSAESLISNVQDGASAASVDQFSSVTSLNYGTCFEMAGHNSSDLPSFGVSTSNLFGATEYHHGSDYGSNQPIPSYQNYFGQTLDNLQPTGTASTTFLAESAADFQMNLFDSTAPPSYLFPPALNKKSANVEAKSNVKPNPKPANNLIPTSLYSSTVVDPKPNQKLDNSLTPASTAVLYPSNTEPKPNLKPDNNLIPASKGVFYPSNVEAKPNLKPDNNLIPASSRVFYQTTTMSSPTTNQGCQKSNSNFPLAAKSNSNFPPAAKSNSNFPPAVKSNSNYPPAAKSNSNFPPAAKSNSNFLPAANCNSSAANLTASSSSTNSLANFNMSTIFPEMNDKVDPAVAQQHHINQQQKQQQTTTVSQQQTATTTTNR